MAYKMKKKTPCWKGYEMIGTKKKGGKPYLTVYLKRKSNGV